MLWRVYTSMLSKMSTLSSDHVIVCFGEVFQESSSHYSLFRAWGDSTPTSFAQILLFNVMVRLSIGGSPRSFISPMSQSQHYVTKQGLHKVIRSTICKRPLFDTLQAQIIWVILRVLHEMSIQKCQQGLYISGNAHEKVKAHTKLRWVKN